MAIAEKTLRKGKFKTRVENATKHACNSTSLLLCSAVNLVQNVGGQAASGLKCIKGVIRSGVKDPVKVFGKFHR